jgi:hypothetical protein
MSSAIRERLEIFRDIAGRPWFRVVGLIWFFVGAWDLTLSQFIPEEYSRNLPKLYQVVGMTAGWLSLWAWLMLGALLVVAGAVEWAFRHKKRYLELLHQAPIPGGDQANFRGIVVDHPSDMPIGASVPIVERSARSPSVTINEEWSVELVRWSQLYEEYDVENGKELRLRFLPDTDDQASDALLLICYGYKVIKKIDAIPSRFANNQIEYLLQNAPGTRQPYIVGIVASINIGQKRDFGQKCIIDGDIERIALSRGGKYQLTFQGENKAKALAREMIRRA